MALHAMETAARRRRHWSRGSKVLAAALGMVLAGAGAFAASNWVVGLSTGSSGEGQSATIQNLTITAVAATVTNLLYPGGTGDVVVTISNPNPYPVTITDVQLPSNTTYADGFSNSALSVSQAGCTASTPSGVTWAYSTSSIGSSHSITPITVAASGKTGNPLTVTFTNDAAMASTAPLACANTYFSMPAFTGVTATGGAATPTSSPATDSWTS